MLKIAIIFVVTVIFSTADAETVRPCAFHNHKCIGKNLAANSRCSSRVKGFIPPVYKVKEFRFETPYFNASYIDHDLIVKNHHKCFVSEFFMNPDSGAAVLTIDCPNLDLESDRTLIQHRSKREDSFYHYHVHARYPMIRITVTLNGHRDLCLAHVYAEVCELPIFNVRPQDHKTANYLSRDMSLLDIFERENFYFRGFPLLRIFVDKLICDFGCWPELQQIH
ncbi:hypothetical protein PYW07_011902 [Mythimna separata]|uniref:25 kDa silk glycoprotein n=1 Tax=Mythimna separata TaxID=271217 RepID=A0AAD7Y7C2_MYTSE|nr:hypothetical protein PYW07_011902 [Mythimna separata]